MTGFYRVSDCILVCLSRLYREIGGRTAFSSTIDVTEWVEMVLNLYQYIFKVQCV
jgi:hypothetical protein